MAAVVRPFEPVYDVSQPRAAFRQIRRIDLRNIAQAENFSGRSGTGDERFHLLWSQVLSLVNNEELVDERSSTHEIERFYLDARANQIERGRTSPFAGTAICLVEHVKVVL